MKKPYEQTRRGRRVRRRWRVENRRRVAAYMRDRRLRLKLEDLVNGDEKARAGPPSDVPARADEGSGS